MVDPCQFPSMIIKKCPLETKSLKSANQLKRARENLRTGIQIIQDVHVHTCTLSKSEYLPVLVRSSVLRDCPVETVSCGHVTQGHLPTDQCGLLYELH